MKNLFDLSVQGADALEQFCAEAARRIMELEDRMVRMEANYHLHPTRVPVEEKSSDG